MSPFQRSFFPTLWTIREVYEHIYETVDVEGSPDIRASATAKATVAAFAASEGHAHPRYQNRTETLTQYTLPRNPRLQEVPYLLACVTNINKIDTVLKTVPVVKRRSWSRSCLFFCLRLKIAAQAP